MSVSLVHLTTYPNAGHLGTDTFTIPATTPGNTLILVFAWNAGGGGFITLSDNAGDTFHSAFPSNPNQGVSQPNTGCGVDMWYATGIGTATSITFSSAFNPYIWVYEVTPVTFDNNVAFTSSNNLGTPIPVVGPSVTGGASSFYVGVAATFTNNVLSVNAPWTLETTLNGNGATHYIGTGTQTPTFSESGSNTDKFNFIAATFSPAPSPPTSAGLLFKLSSSQLSDQQNSGSGTAINSTYTTYGFVNAAKSTQNPLLGFHRKRFSETQMYIKGSGQATMKAFPNYILKQDGLTFNPYVYTAPPIVLQTDPIDDIVRPLNISGNRVFVMYSTNAVGAAFSLSKTILCGNIDGFSTVNPNA